MIRLGEVTAGRAAALVFVALIAFALKRHYAHAPTEALWWILTPTAHLVGLVTGTAFTVVPGEGYFSAERLFLIEKACAGVNFLIAAFAMVAVARLSRVRSAGQAVAVLGLSFVGSYLTAVLVNTVRIVIAMWLAGGRVTLGGLTAAEIHRLEGIVVYFGGLLLLSQIVQRADRGTRLGRVVLPLGCYYLVTLGLPLAHGAAQTNPAFLAHLWTVLVLPPLLIVFVFGIQRLTHSLGRTPRKV